MQQRARSQIERWETDEVLFSSLRETKLADVSVIAEIVHPVFSDGGAGEPKLNVTVHRASKNGREFSLRLMCPQGDLTEMTSLSEMLNELVAKSEDCSKQLNVRREIWNDRRIRQHNHLMELDKQTSRRKGNKDVGAGLSRFTNGSKTKKRKSRKERER